MSESGKSLINLRTYLSILGGEVQQRLLPLPLLGTAELLAQTRVAHQPLDALETTQLEHDKNRDVFRQLQQAMMEMLLPKEGNSHHWIRHFV